MPYGSIWPWTMYEPRSASGVMPNGKVLLDRRSDSPTNIVARVHLRGHIAAGLLDRAAAALAAEHPLLRVSIRIDADGTNPTFVPSAGAVPVRRVNGDYLEWERQVDDHEVGTPLDWRRGPLIRMLMSRWVPQTTKRMTFC